MNKDCYQATKYPGIYRHCYWGSAPLEETGDFITPEIIANRNRFVEDFNIRCASRAKWKTAGNTLHVEERTVSGEVDHLELYRTTEDELVMLCSNYNRPPPDELEMKQIYPVYSTDCDSYVRVFDSLKEFRATMTSLYYGI